MQKAMVDEKKVFRYLIGAATLLTAVHVINLLCGKPFWTITLLFDLNKEGNIPTWFSSILWAGAAMISYFCAVKLAATDKKESNFWKIAGSIFLFLSCDEVAQFHERLGQLLERRIFHSGLRAEWIIFFGPILVVGIGIFILYFLKYLKKNKGSLKWILSGIGVFCFGSTVLEAISNFIPMSWIAGEIVLEEYAEMVGAIFVIRGVMTHFYTSEM